MASSSSEQKFIIEQESAWIDADQFEPRDLSSFLALAEPPKQARDDDRFSQNDIECGQLRTNSNSLREFIASPDERKSKAQIENNCSKHY